MPRGNEMKDKKMYLTCPTCKKYHNDCEYNHDINSCWVGECVAANKRVAMHRRKGIGYKESIPTVICRKIEYYFSDLERHYRMTIGPPWSLPSERCIRERVARKLSTWCWKFRYWVL